MRKEQGIMPQNSMINLYSGRMTRSRKSLTGVPRIERGWIRSKTDESTGSGGDTRRFEIDFDYYSNCLLPRNKPFYVKKYFLVIGDNLDYGANSMELHLEENAIAYIATFEKDKIDTNDSPENVLWNDHIAVRVCGEGKFVETNSMTTSDEDRVGSSGNHQSAKRCGLATILSYLCYLDREIEPSIKGVSDLGYEFDLELKEANDVLEREQLQRFIQLVKKSCKRILKVVTTAKPSVGGRSYIYAGMDTGYQYLMTIGKDSVNHAVCHHMEELNRLFRENPPKKHGEEIIDPILDKLIEKEGNKWFFCKVK